MMTKMKFDNFSHFQNVVSNNNIPPLPVNVIIERCLRKSMCDSPLMAHSSFDQHVSNPTKSRTIEIMFLLGRVNAGSSKCIIFQILKEVAF